jgi:hypothetical protein
MIGNGVFKHVRSFDESKEKIIDIKNNSFHSIIMDVVKVVMKIKERVGASFPSKVEKWQTLTLGKSHLTHLYQKQGPYDGDMYLFLMGSLMNRVRPKGNTRQVTYFFKLKNTNSFERYAFD